MLSNYNEPRLGLFGKRAVRNERCAHFKEFSKAQINHQSILKIRGSWLNRKSVYSLSAFDAGPVSNDLF